MTNLSNIQRFEQAMLPYLNTAFNLAMWLLRDNHDAEDAVQEAYLRALRHFESFRGGDGRVWLLAIVRNVCFSQLQAKKGPIVEVYEEDIHSGQTIESSVQLSHSADPALTVLQQADKTLINQAIMALPPDFKEVIVLRELEEFSYKEIAKITGVPMGTVMSRLARARQQLREALDQEFTPGAHL